MQGLPNSEGISRLPDVQPSLPALRGKAHSANWSAGYWANRSIPASYFSAERLAGVRAQRATNQGFGQRSNGLWPGADIGVRAPIGDETPLSPEEVMYFHRGEVVRT